MLTRGSELGMTRFVVFGNAHDFTKETADAMLKQAFPGKDGAARKARSVALLVIETRQHFPRVMKAGRDANVTHVSNFAQSFLRKIRKGEAKIGDVAAHAKAEADRKPTVATPAQRIETLAKWIDEGFTGGDAVAKALRAIDTKGLRKKPKKAKASAKAKTAKAEGENLTDKELAKIMADNTGMTQAAALKVIRSNKK